MAGTILSGGAAIIDDIEAIKRLKASYCAAADNGHDPEEFASLYIEDAIWESADFGCNKGLKEIKALAVRFGELISFSRHMVMNPVINVRGQHAHGTWSLMAAINLRHGSGGQLILGAYDEDYVKTGSGWKFLHVRGFRLASTDIPAGWQQAAIW